MEIKRIYTRKMALYLIERGFRYIRTVQDITKPNFQNWLFEDTEALENAIGDYMLNKR